GRRARSGRPVGEPRCRRLPGRRNRDRPARATGRPRPLPGQEPRAQPGRVGGRRRARSERRRRRAPLSERSAGGAGAPRRPGLSPRRARDPLQIGYPIAMESGATQAAAGAVGGEAYLGRALKRVVRDGAGDHIAVEAPLEIRVDGAPIAVTMRTPGNDEELAAGFLFGEGLIDAAPTVSLTREMAANTVEVAGPLLREPSARRFYTTSSCGVCGKGALEEVAVQAPRAPEGPPVHRAVLAGLPDRL